VRRGRDEVSQEKRVEGSFSFGEIQYEHGLEGHLPREAVVEEDYFVHFERIYRIGREGVLIKCAFGSFDRPEHKYLMIDREGCRYYASTPVKTRVNHQAHQKIVEYIHVK